ncbi:TFIIB-type zinc ribbon-containing protein [Salana multivorans]
MPHDPTPRYEPYVSDAPPAGHTCPKCVGSMRTVDRNGVHIEQCTSCRGVFLDYGELEHVIALESRVAATPPPAAADYGPGPEWGRRDGRRYRRGGLAGLFFSS